MVWEKQNEMGGLEGTHSPTSENQSTTDNALFLPKLPKTLSGQFLSYGTLFVLLSSEVSII